MTFTLPMAPAQQIWSQFYGSLLQANPSLLPSLARYFAGATSVAQVQERCLQFLDNLEVTFTAADGTEHTFDFRGEAALEVDLPPGVYSLAVDLPIELIQNPFAITFDAVHPNGYLKPVHPDSVQAEEADILRFRAEGIRVEEGKTVALGPLQAPTISGLVGGAQGVSGPEGGAHPAPAAVSLRGATYRGRVQLLVVRPGYQDFGRIDADSDGHFFVFGGDSGTLARYKTSPFELVKSAALFNNGRYSDIAVKAHGDYVYASDQGLSRGTTKLQRYGKQSFEEFGSKIDLDKVGYSVNWMEHWAVSTNGYLFARDEASALVIASLESGDAVRFDEFEFREVDNDVFAYDVVAAQNEYNYAFVAGKREGGDTNPGIYKISKDGNLIRSFGHSENIIPKSPGTLGVDRKRNVYVLRRGGTNEGYYGSNRLAITVYDTSGEFLGYIDLSALAADDVGFSIADIAVDLDDHLLVLTAGTAGQWVYRWDLTL